jgi:hypothetical protein
MDPTTIAQTLTAYAQPARPVSPTPMTQDDLMDALYGPGQSLPSWIPQNVQDYINQAPSFNEGQRQAMRPADIAGGEPYTPTPQIGDLQRLFQNRITRNAPTSNPIGGKFLRDVTLGGHLAGGNEI